MLVGERIRERRTQLKMSQAQLAEKDMTRAYISQIETGLKTPSDELLNVIARRLRLNAEDLTSEIPENQIVEAAICQAHAQFNSKNYVLCRAILQQIEKRSFIPVRVQGHIMLIEGRCAAALGDYAEATYLIEQSLSLFTPKDDYPLYVQALFYRANASYFMEDFRQAIHYYCRVVEISQGHKRLQELSIQARVFLGSCYYRLGMFVESRQSYVQGLSEAKAVNDLHSVVNAMLGLGWILYHLGMLTEAIQTTTEALRVSARVENQMQVELKHNLAIYYKAKGQFALAQHIIADCINTYEARKDYRSLVAALEEMAELYFDSSDAENAQRTLNRALDILEQVQSPLLYGRIYRVVAKALLLNGEPVMSDSYLKLAVSYFKMCNAKREIETTLAIRKKMEKRLTCAMLIV